jgi:hypothetical protein
MIACPFNLFYPSNCLNLISISITLTLTTTSSTQLSAPKP